MYDRAAALMDLTPEQLDRIRLVLEQELQEAWRTTADGGKPPAAIAALLGDRRRATDQPNAVQSDSDADYDPRHSAEPD